MVRRAINSRHAATLFETFSSASFCGLEFHFRDLIPTGSCVDYRMAMPRLFAFYLPRVLVPDRRKIEDTVRKAIQ
jgi:hypothetical protein